MRQLPMRITRSPVTTAVFGSLVQTARVDPDWFSENVGRFVGRPMPRLRNSARPKEPTIWPESHCYRMKSIDNPISRKICARHLAQNPQSIAPDDDPNTHALRR